MAQNKEKNDPGKPLPIKMIVVVLILFFTVVVIGFMILPAYFDKTPFGKLFHNEPAPWAISEKDQQKYNYSETELKGRYHYVEYCASCHGPSGKGDGPLSVTLKKRPPSFINPSSLFKNEISQPGLLKTINEGIPNSEMPSFSYLPIEVKNQITEFLIHMDKNKNFY